MANSTAVQEAIELTMASRIPLFTSGKCLYFPRNVPPLTECHRGAVASLTWVLHDYRTPTIPSLLLKHANRQGPVVATVGDEVRYVWVSTESVIHLPDLTASQPSRWNVGKILFFWVRDLDSGFSRRGPGGAD